MPVAELVAVMDDALERAAREVFDINRVSELMVEAAANGAWGMRIVQELPRDLRGTRAAAKLTGWLGDCGYQSRWIELPRQARNGQMAPHWELVVCWKGDVDGLL
jgi:hypothetical protein